jgi:hypothetical protein
MHTKPGRHKRDAEQSGNLGEAGECAEAASHQRWTIPAAMSFLGSVDMSRRC